MEKEKTVRKKKTRKFCLLFVFVSVYQTIVEQLEDDWFWLLRTTNWDFKENWKQKSKPAKIVQQNRKKKKSMKIPKRTLFIINANNRFIFLKKTHKLHLYNNNKISKNPNYLFTRKVIKIKTKCLFVFYSTKLTKKKL